MAPIATYVFLDLETTGIPSEENNKTKITELSMVAVKRDHLLVTRPGASPRVQHKLTLCFNPGRLVQPGASEVTGLCNDLLEFEPTFNKQVYSMINNFLDILSKPVCLIAQNGHGFDFPILKNHFVKLNVGLSDDVMCADCYHAFFDIMEAAKNSTSVPVKESSSSNEISTEVKPWDETDLSAIGNTLHMKSANESTPKQSTSREAATTPRKENKNRVSHARRRFPWSEGSKPQESYKLRHIYERLLNRPAEEAHRAENDCVFALECSAVLSTQFVAWVDEHYVPFADIKPMTIGVRLGE